MKNKTITSDWIDRFNEGLLTEEETEIFKERMSNDPVLRAEVRMDAELNAFLADTERLAIRDKIRKVIEKERSPVHERKYYLMAAVILMLLAISGFLLIREALQRSERFNEVSTLKSGANELGASYKTLTGRHEDAVISKTPVTRRQMARNTVAEQDFRPLPELEILSGAFTRSVPLKILSPKPGTMVHQGEKVAFRWNGSGRIQLSFILLNNRGLPVKQVNHLGEGCYILETRELNPGLYYWKFLENENLQALGKITIK